LKDKSVAGRNLLTGPVFDVLPKFAGPKVIYAAANRMGGRAAREGITFKQTPYALELKAMTPFAPKTYQQQVLDSVEAYFKACHELPSPSIAFTATTERLWGRGNAYNPLSGFPPDMPYFCLRVPTGGGKTWLAAKSIQLANTH